MSRGRYPMQSVSGERARATAMARKRRAGCEAVEEGEPPKGGEPGANGGGAQRRHAMRLGKASGEPPAMGAERPSYGGGNTGSCHVHVQAEARSERQRAKCARDRHRNGEDRVSGLRGAGRGGAASGGIEPGDRSEGPGGRPDHPTGGADDGGPSSATMEDGPQAIGFGECRTRAATDESVAASSAGSGRRGS